MWRMTTMFRVPSRVFLPQFLSLLYPLFPFFFIFCCNILCCQVRPNRAWFAESVICGFLLQEVYNVLCFDRHLCLTEIWAGIYYCRFEFLQIWRKKWQARKGLIGFLKHATWRLRAFLGRWRTKIWKRLEAASVPDWPSHLWIGCSWGERKRNFRKSELHVLFLSSSKTTVKLLHMGRESKESRDEVSVLHYGGSGPPRSAYRRYWDPGCLSGHRIDRNWLLILSLRSTHPDAPLKWLSG